MAVRSSLLLADLGVVSVLMLLLKEGNAGGSCSTVLWPIEGKLGDRG